MPSSTELSGLATPKRGRPRLISDMALLQRRDNLLSAIERQWAEFAWEMQQAESMPSLRRALHPIGSRPGMEMFVHAPTQKTDAKGFATLCKKIECTSRELGFADQALEEAKEHLARIVGALNNSDADDRLKQLQQRYEARYSDAKLHYERLDSSLKALEGQRRNQEAYLVQSQLLHLLTCKRYKITPVNIADAMAGVPFITWRVSRQRSLNMVPHPHEGLAYQMLQVLIEAFALNSLTNAKPASHIKRYLLTHKIPEQAIAKLREDWYYVQEAIETVCAKKKVKLITAYGVFHEYSRRRSSQSRYDLVVATEVRL